MLAIDLKDKLLLLASAVLAVFAAYMLVQPQPSPFLGPISTTPIAEVRSFTNIVKKKPVQSLSWEGLAKENQLYQGDQVFTHEDSFAEIVYKDSTSLNLLPNTLLKIEDTSEGINLDLKKGFLSLNFSKSTNKSVNIKVGNKEVSLASKDAKFQISKVENNSQITLLSGKAKIGSDKSAKVLKKGDTVLIDAAKKEIEITQTSILPIEPRMGSVVRFDEGALKISWKPKDDLPKDIEYKLEVSKSPNLTNAKTYFVKDTSHMFQYAPPGSYFWRVSTDKGKSMTSNFIVPSPNIPRPLAPADKSIIDIAMKEKNTKVNLSWTGRYPKGFAVYIQRNDEKARLLPAKSNSLTLEDLSGGTYQWKVKAYEEGAAWSPMRSFTIQRENYLKPINPIADKEFNILSLKEKIKFEWFGLKNEKYKFQIFKDIEMKNEVFSKSIQGTSASLSMKKFGTYFWKVSSIEYEDVSTPPLPFSVKASIASLVAPKDSQKYVMTKDEYPVNFQWKNLGLKEYPAEFQVSMSKTFDEILSKEKISGTKKLLKFDVAGDYFWRIVPENVENEDLSSSDVRSFSLSLPPEPVAPKIKLKQLLEYVKGYNIEQYVISWPQVKYGKEYVIEIYDKGNLKERLTRAKVKSTKILWRGERSGSFYYRVKVIDQWGRESGWSKTGQLIAPISPFD